VRHNGRALAGLDAILCRDWEYRYFSFDTAWYGVQEMASMRSGTGDRCFIVFEPRPIIVGYVKELAHRLQLGPGVLRSAARASVPEELSRALEEPAFDTDYLTIFAWYDGSCWRQFIGEAHWGPELVESRELLRWLGGPAVYHEWACDYYERDLPFDALAELWASLRIDEVRIGELGAELDAALVSDLSAIGWSK